MFAFTEEDRIIESLYGTDCFSLMADYISLAIEIMAEESLSAVIV